jgi:primary-amine oxidase
MSRRTLARMLLAGSLVSSLPPLAAAAATTHPLDPLTFQEHFAVIEVLHAAGKVDAETRFTRIAVKEPDKAAVWAWKPGVKVPRAAEAVLRQGPAVFEAVVDLDARRLASWVERPGAQGMWLQGDFEHPVVEKVLKDARVVEALKRRGVRDLHFVTCITLPPGNFGEPRYEGRRIGVLSCRERSGFRNTWARRIEGLVVVVDMNTSEIVEVADDETVPVQRGGQTSTPRRSGRCASSRRRSRCASRSARASPSTGTSSRGTAGASTCGRTRASAPSSRPLCGETATATAP